MACAGLCWLALARSVSLRLVVARSRLPWLVPACPGQIWRPNSTTLMSWWPSAFWRLSFALALTESIVSRAASISGKFHQKSTTSTGACQNVDFPPLKLHGLCTPVWHVCCVASNKAPRRVTSQANTSSHGSIWLVLACPALSWLVLACSGLSWLFLARPGLSWLVPTKSGGPNATTLMRWWPNTFRGLSFALALTEPVVSRAMSISGKFHQKSTRTRGACQNMDFPPLKLHGLCGFVFFTFFHVF